MSMPGWYPDPAGAPGRFRYWDGTAWSQETTGDPASAAPRPAATTTTQGFATQQPRRGGLGWLAFLAALLVLALLVWAVAFRGGSSPTKVAAEDTNTAAPSGPVWNEKDTPTPSPSGSDPAPTGGAMVSCPTTGGQPSRPAANGRLSGGGLSIPAIDGWDDAGYFFTLPWTQDLAARSSVVLKQGGTTWFSVEAVGALPMAEGFTTPQASARMMMDCFASSGYYSQFQGRKDVSGEAVTVDGHQGYHLRSEVYVAMPELPQVQGDVIDVVVVDTGSASTLGVFVSSATIGDSGRQQQVDAARKAMTVG